MQPFSNVFAVPNLPPGPFAVAFEQAFRVELRQAVRLVRFNARADPAVQLNPVRGLKILAVSYHGSNFLRNHSNGLRRRYRGTDQNFQNVEKAEFHRSREKLK